MASVPSPQIEVEVGLGEKAGSGVGEALSGRGSCNERTSCIASRRWGYRKDRPATPHGHSSAGDIPGAVGEARKCGWLILVGSAKTNRIDALV